MSAIMFKASIAVAKPNSCPIRLTARVDGDEEMKLRKNQML